MIDASADNRLKARNLYFQGYSTADIARMLVLPYGTVDAWKRRDKWDDAPAVARLEANFEARLNLLIAKDDKSDRELAEIDFLMKQMERVERAKRFSQGEGGGGDGAQGGGGKGRGRRKKEEKNFLTEEQVQALVDAFEHGLFGYQEGWRWALKYRVRSILKSRQIGATYYFAREALIDAITTGDNQIFLSASKAQAFVFREYIVQFVKEVTGVDLKGNPITLWNGATLYFLGTNSKTAQSYSGHVYCDEFAWIGRFREFNKVASAMATHKKWRKTYFSTPSVLGHDSAGFWNGDWFNKGKPKDRRVEFDVSHAALKGGAVGPDGTWRQIVTIEDAASGGCDLFDIEALRLEYNDQDFANLFMAQWVDDEASYFTFSELRRCMVDSLEEWYDVHPHETRPYGDLPVWIGYDPSKSGDNASIVVVAPPRPGSNSQTFRLLEKLFVTGSDWEAQAGAILALCGRYNVEHIGIDSTTIGQGVFELVRRFFPAAKEITYSVDVKTRLVLKAKQLISKGRFEFDAGHSDIALSFLSIKQTATPSGRQATFSAGRTKETGHADVAWAIMHALDKLNFTDFDQAAGWTGGGFVEIF